MDRLSTVLADEKKEQDATRIDEDQDNAGPIGPPVLSERI